MNSKKLAGAAAAAVLAAGVSLAAGQAHAVAPTRTAVPVSSHMASITASADPTGICGSGTGGCWRDTGPAYFWPRDISGDAHQQFDVVYWGQSPGADNGACDQYSNTGVFTFQSPADGYKFLGAATYSNGKYYVGDQVANNVYSNWAWDSDGVLINCGDSPVGHGSWTLQHGNYYTQLWTQNTVLSPEWQQVHV